MVPPPPAQGAQATSAAKTDFASKVQTAAAQGTDSARTQQAKQTQSARLTGKARDIARRLQSGEVDQREATREFVALVIEERFPNFRRRKKKQRDRQDEGTAEERLEEAVTELIEQDPVLAQRLTTQFKKLAGKEDGGG